MFNGAAKKADRLPHEVDEDQNASRAAVESLRKAGRRNKEAIEEAMKQLQQRRQEAAAP